MEGAVAKGSWKISDTLWAEIAPLLPPEKPKPKGGCPRMPDRPAMEAIFYALRTVSVEGAASGDGCRQHGT